mgnify:CR=1 FL=1
MSIENTLEERGSRYGEFANHAQISQEIQNAIIKGWYSRGDGQEITTMPPYMLESLSMIAHKIGRIVNGDPFYDDSWRDIAGYATLVVQELEKIKDIRIAESDKENTDAEKKLQENGE